MEKITFNDIPEALTLLHQSVNELKVLLQDRNYHPPPEVERPLMIEEAAKFLSLSVPTVRSRIKKGLPVMKKGNRCYFFKSELAKYIESGRKKTDSEIDAETDLILATQKRKGGKNA